MNMKARFFASVAVLVALLLYVAAVFFSFVLGAFWPLIACPVLLAVVVGFAGYVEYLNAERS